MKIESPSYTVEDFHNIIGGYFDRERAEVVARLRALADGVDALVPSIGDGGSEDDPAWNAHETLAHVATTAAFFGWVVSQVAKGNEIGEQMVQAMNLRDPAIVEAVRQPATDLAAELRKSLDRTIQFLEQADIDDLRTSITFAGRQVSASDFARVSMVHHLEDHLEQMRTALAAG